MTHVYLLIGFDSYYPSPDNTLRVFYSEERANKFMDKLKKASNRHRTVDYIELKSKYDWLPETIPENFQVVSKKVDRNGY